MRNKELKIRNKKGLFVPSLIIIFCRCNAFEKNSHQFIGFVKCFIYLFVCNNWFPLYDFKIYP